MKRVGVKSRMRHSGVNILLLSLLSAFAVPEDKTKQDGKYGAQRCAPKVISGMRSKSPEFHFGKGERYTDSPVVAYEVLESGEIAHAILKRSSGVSDVDKYAIKWVQGLKYNNRPGCGVFKSTANVTIDFR